MEKKEIRVLALDLDGTLTNDQKAGTYFESSHWL